MVVCGIEMAASEARLAILAGTKTSFAWRAVKPQKLALSDDEDGEEVKAFRDSIYAFLRENGVQLVAIKKRAKRGDYAGGPVGFKLEAILQLYSECDVTLVPSQSVAAAEKRHGPAFPQGLRKYQRPAFLAAFAALPQ